MSRLRRDPKTPLLEGPLFPPRGVRRDPSRTPKGPLQDSPKGSKEGLASQGPPRPTQIPTGVPWSPTPSSLFKKEGKRPKRDLTEPCPRKGPLGD